MSVPPFRVTTRADMTRLIDVIRQHAPHRVPLLEAAHDGVLTLVEMRRQAAFPAAELQKHPDRAHLVVCGDDDYADTGPDGWACRAALAGWARGAVIHASGGKVEEYRAAVAWSLQLRRVALIETGTIHGPAWHRVFAGRHIPTLNFITHPGQFQPVPLPKGSVH